MSPVTNCLNKLCLTLVQLVYTLTALKIIFLYVQGCEKRKPKHIITDQSQNKIRILFLIKLNRSLSRCCRAAVKPRGWNSFLSSMDSQLSSFNEQHFFSLNLGQTYISTTLDLETQFLEVFKQLLDLPKYKLSAFCQRISQLHKIVIHVPNK